MSIVLTCQYCNGQYNTVSNLKRHQKTAKSCLKIQEENNDTLVKCQYCNKEFSCKSNLNRHIKTSKTCCIPQTVTIDLIKEEFYCLGCNKQFINKVRLEIHKASCLELKDKLFKDMEHKLLVQIKDNEEKYFNEQKNTIDKFRQEKKNLEDRLYSLEKENKELSLQYTRSDCKLKLFQEQLVIQQKLNENLQNRLLQKATSKTVTNNTTNVELNLFMSKECVDDKINRLFTIKYIYDGYLGVARFVKDNIVTDNSKLLYSCVDPAREIFVYKDDKGNEAKDVKATKLLELTTTGLKEKTAKIHAKELDEYKYLIDRYEDEVVDDDTKKRIEKHRHNAEIAQDLLINNLYNDKFSSKMSKELVKILS
jgi:hypothetical protein